MKAQKLITLEVECPFCQMLFTAANAYAGSKHSCPHCGGTVEFEAAEAPEEPKQPPVGARIQASSIGGRLGMTDSMRATISTLSVVLCILFVVVPVGIGIRHAKQAKVEEKARLEETARVEEQARLAEQERVTVEEQERLAEQERIAVAEQEKAELAQRGNARLAEQEITLREEASFTPVDATAKLDAIPPEWTQAAPYYLDAPSLAGVSTSVALSILKASGVWETGNYDKVSGGIVLRAKDGTSGLVAIHQGKVIWVNLVLPRALPGESSSLALIAVRQPPPPDKTWACGFAWTAGFGVFKSVEVIVSRIDTILNAYFVPARVVEQWAEAGTGN